MKKNKKKPAERLYTALGDLDPALVESARGYRPPRKSAAPTARRITAMILAATLLLGLLTLTVFAAVPALRGIINMPFLNENAQKDEVPEGWTGIYTVSDLDRIRDNLNGKYILMNDLAFTESDGAFTPIGTQAEPFMGQFDGNGYVIRNLTIDVTQPEPMISLYEDRTAHDVTETCNVGLFGYCGYATMGTEKVYIRELGDYNYPYLIDDQPYRGMICNLGVENARIRINSASNARVGVIAGQASYVAACYVKNCTIDLTGYEVKAEIANLLLRMGGIAGNVQVLDSCYASNCSLSVTGTKNHLSNGRHIADGTQLDKAAVFIGGLAGNAYTAVTSYVDGGEIICDYAENRELDQNYVDWAWYLGDCPAYTGELFGHAHRIPCVMNESHYRAIQEAVYRGAFGLSADEPLPENWFSVDCNDKNNDHYQYGKFRTFFIKKTAQNMVDYFGLDPSHVNPSLVTGGFTWENNMYMLDRATRMEEVLWLEYVAEKYIGEENLANLVSLDNLKVGPHYCYTIDPPQNYTKDDFTEFNFKTVWKMKEGRPVLRIFE